MTETWESGDEGELAVKNGFPWPPPEEGPILTALGATWKGATFDPGRFFAGTPRDGGTGAALVYYLALGILVAGVSLFWSAILLPDAAGEASLMAQLGVQPINPLVRFLLAPAILLFALFVSAGVVHVLLLIFDGATHGFGTTVRVFCYAYSPAIFGLVPIIGPLVGGVWSVVLAIIGLREAHEASAWKPAVAVLTPLVGVMILTILMFLIAAMAVGGALPAG